MEVQRDERLLLHHTEENRKERSNDRVQDHQGRSGVHTEELLNAQPRAAAKPPRKDNEMTQHNYSTLGELIAALYPDSTIYGGSAPMDMDVSHGAEIEEITDFVTIYPYVKWTDGTYRPCHYWGGKYYIWLRK